MMRVQFPLRATAAALFALAGAQAQATLNGTVMTGPAVPDWVVGNFSCSGTLITARVAVTAQHCVDGMDSYGFYHRKTGTPYPSSAVAGFPRRVGVLGDVGLVMFPMPFGGGSPATALVPTYRQEKALLSDPVRLPTGAEVKTVLSIYGRDHVSNDLRGSARAAQTYLQQPASATPVPLTYRSFARATEWKPNFYYEYTYFWWKATQAVYDLMYTTPEAQGGLAFSRLDTDDLIVGLTEHNEAPLFSPVSAGDSGGGIFASRDGGPAALVANVSGTVVHPRLSAYWPWIYKTLMDKGLRGDAVGLARKVLGTGNWGDNDRKATVGDIFVHENSYNGDVEFFRLAALGDDGRYWYFPTTKRDNTWWEYLGTALPDREQATTPIKTWGSNDRRGTVGDVFIYANPYNGAVEYFQLKALGSDGRYWYFPTDRRDNIFWNYLGTDLPTRKLKWVN